MAISYGCWLNDDTDIVDMMKFNDSTFFYICLPPIVFASGFNMQRGNFFANIKNILMFGVLGTFVCFFGFSALTIYFKNLGFINQYDGKTGKWSSLELTSPECMLMCSLLCSSDVIAAISLISYEKQPRLFSIIFGEGIINDAVSIILFNTVMKYTASTQVIDVSTPFKILANFFALGFNSLFIGLIFGLMSSYILK
jgi:NhaP-type Na+/H+ or K+/H+ antiporter